jgi:DNA-binding PadR family transcriptional regulator
VPKENPISPLALAVLGLLAGGPLHPYRMERLLREWGKDQVIRIGQRANLYTAIKRLHAAGAIAVRQTERDQQYPERTVYEITGDGRDLFAGRLTGMLSAPREEYPEFPAALSFLMLLSPGDATAALGKRASQLRAAAAALEEEMAQAPGIPRVALIESEYQRAMLGAELAWTDAVLADLRTGALTWSADDFAEAAEAYRLG